MRNEVYPKIFTWLFIGLLVSFATGYALSTNLDMLKTVANIGLFPILIIEIGIAIALGTCINKLSPTIMKLLYLVYSFTTGLTLSFVFIVYEMQSVITIFLTTAIITGLMALYGYKTKSDLSKIGKFLTIGLIGMIIGSLLNIFLFKNTIVDTGLSLLGVGIFTILIAYDINRVKYLVPAVGEEKAAIYGAFQIYLDFINLFLRLLSLFGKEN